MKLNDFGFSTIDPVNIGKIEKESIESRQKAINAAGSFNSLKELIMPLLLNLQKDPHKDIHWPNRDQKIGEIIKKIEFLEKNLK